MTLEAFTKRRMLLKIEPTEGVDSLPTGAVNAVLLLNGTSKIDGTVIERTLDRDVFGHDPFLISNFKGTVEGDIELIGNAVPGTAPGLSALLQISGLAETLDAVGPPASARYNPISVGIPSASSYSYHAGTLRKFTGTRAAISGVTFGIGKAPTAKVQIIGNATGDEAEAAAPVAVLTAFQAPIPVTTASWELTINGFPVSATELTLDFGTDLKIVEHSEDKVALISARKPTWSATFYRPALASLDVFALRKAHTPVAVVSTLDGGVAGQKVVLTIGTGQIEQIEDTDVEGFRAYKVTGRAIPTDAGNDEFILSFE